MKKHLRGIKVNLLVNSPTIMQCILLVYVQVADSFAGVSKILRTRLSLKILAVMHGGCVATSLKSQINF